MNLSEYLKKYNKLAVAFSGGVDSAYLLYEAKKNVKDVKAYYVKSQFQPEFEYRDALKLADYVGAEMEVIELDVLSCREVRENPANRCYYCKKQIFSAIVEAAKKDGFQTVADGTNASDSASDRPGMKALCEMSVISPLRECGLTKDMIREKSKEANLETWDKPAYACLATRIPQGVEITAEKLSRTEKSEDYLFSLGFTDFRVRERDEGALVQLPKKYLPLSDNLTIKIENELKKYYNKVTIDKEGR